MPRLPYSSEVWQLPCSDRTTSQIAPIRGQCSRGCARHSGRAACRTNRSLRSCLGVRRFAVFPRHDRFGNIRTGPALQWSLPRTEPMVSPALDLRELRCIEDPRGAGSAVNHSNQGASAGKAPIAAVVQSAGVDLISEPTMAAVRQGDSEPARQHPLSMSRSATPNAAPPRS